MTDRRVPITSDPPFHKAARRMLLPAFGSRAVAALEPFTRRLCRTLLDQTEDLAIFDAAARYTQHIPVGVIVRYLGFRQIRGPRNLPVRIRRARYRPAHP